jgi:hypothetical protein
MPFLPVIVSILALVVSGCATTLVQATPKTSSPPLCAAGVDLGAATVTLATAWRPDQKEPQERARLAREAITNAFGRLRCGRFAGFDAAAADTDVRIVLREFGPQLLISLPVLWTLHADVDYTMTVTQRSSGAVILDWTERRTFGGPFVLQGMDAVRRTFEAALHDVLDGPSQADSPQYHTSQVRQPRTSSRH